MSCKELFISILLAGAFIQMMRGADLNDSVRAEFFAGFAGNNAALERAMKSSEEVIASNPAASAEAMAWHGGAKMVISGQKFQQGDFAAGGKLWAEAVAEMDKAGALEPDNMAVLVPRAAVWLAASRQAPPDRAKPLLEKALADYEHVFEMQKSYFDTLSIHMRSELLFGLGDGYVRDGNPAKARFYFEKLAAIGAPSGHFEQATQYLEGGNYTVEGIGCVGCHTGARIRR